MERERGRQTDRQGEKGRKREGRKQGKRKEGRKEESHIVMMWVGSRGGRGWAEERGEKETRRKGMSESSGTEVTTPGPTGPPWYHHGGASHRMALVILELPQLAPTSINHVVILA